MKELFCFALVAMTAEALREGQYIASPLNFLFQGKSHVMALSDLLNKKCFLYNLTDAERAEIHTQDGIRQVEFTPPQLTVKEEWAWKCFPCPLKFLEFSEKM